MSRVEGASAECRGELLRRAQRGAIAENERLALSAHLSTCEACRLCHEFMRDFEAVGGADPGDSAVLARISERAMRSVHAPVVRRPRMRWYWLAAASITLLAGFAGATLLNRERLAAGPSVSSATRDLCHAHGNAASTRESGVRAPGRRGSEPKPDAGGHFEPRAREFRANGQ